MDNTITLDAADNGTFFGPLACAYSYRPELRRVVDECFEAAQRSGNRYFVLEGTDVRAAQTSLSGAMHYMKPGRTLLDCSAVHLCSSKK
jgi:hypothetical protein